MAGEDVLSVSDLPPPVAAYIAATNSFDLDALMTTFDENALGTTIAPSFAVGTPFATGRRGRSSATA